MKVQRERCKRNTKRRGKRRGEERGGREEGEEEERSSDTKYNFQLNRKNEYSLLYVRFSLLCAIDPSFSLLQRACFSSSHSFSLSVPILTLYVCLSFLFSLLSLHQLPLHMINTQKKSGLAASDRDGTCRSILRKKQQSSELATRGSIAP